MFDHKRKFIRFKPDAGAYAVIDFNGDANVPFRGQAIALIVEEAPMGGCSLVVLQDVKFNPGAECKVKLGALSPLCARVAWVKQLDEDVSRIGFQFLE